MEKEESFYELLEQYLDEEEIEYKKKIDNNQSKKLNTAFSDSPFGVEDAITINDYVNNFLMIKSDASNLYHSGLKDLKCPYIVGISNDFANKNPELVKQGLLLIVVDCKKRRGTYINPVCLRKLLDKPNIEREYKVLSKKRINDLRELDEFFNEYLIKKSMLEAEQRFYEFIEELHKTRKIDNIRKYEEMGGFEDDKYKRR